MKQIFLIILIILFFSCGKEEKCLPEEINTYYPIPEKYKLEIPYKDGDSVVFLSQTEDTLIYKIKNSENRFVKTSELLGGIDCPGSQNTHTETLVFDFIPYYNNDPKINFTVRGQSINLDFCSVDFYFEPIYARNSDNFKWISSEKSPQDSIYFNGLNYYGRYVNGISNILYNPNLGIMRFKYENYQFTKIY
jgi:hypothetical protein